MIKRMDYRFDEDHPEGKIEQMKLALDQPAGSPERSKEENQPSQKPLDLDDQGLREYMLKRYARKDQRRRERKRRQTHHSQQMLNAKEEKE